MEISVRGSALRRGLFALHRLRIGPHHGAQAEYTNDECHTVEATARTKREGHRSLAGRRIVGGDRGNRKAGRDGLVEVRW
jgi:hypothetical protein